GCWRPRATWSSPVPATATSRRSTPRRAPSWDDSAAGLEFPKLAAGLGVERLEVADAATGADQLALARQHPCPPRQSFLVFPGDLACGGVHGAQDADVVVIHALNAEALAQVGVALLVADFLGPVVLLPVVGRHIEQTGVLAVGHGVPVFAAKEGW